MTNDRHGKGTIEWVGRGDRGRWFAKISVPGEGRRRIALHDPAAGRDLTDREGDRVMAVQLAGELAELMRNEAYAKAAAQLPKRTTVKEFGELWTSGKLYERHGEVRGLRPKKSADADQMRLRAHIFPHLGHRAVADVTEQDIELALAAAARAAEKRMGRPWRQANKLQVFQVAHRLFDLAVKPGRLRTDNPVSADLRPRKDASKLFNYLFPSELVAVLGCTAVPLERRVCYAVATYTGLRKGSLFGLTWADIDFAHSMITSRESKTDLPVCFVQRDPALPGLESLMTILKRWHEHAGCPGADAPVLQPFDCRERREAEVLRGDLRAAGVTRAALYSTDRQIEALRFHDQRSTFCTWARRAGKGWGWVSERTGHLSESMTERYTRAARSLADLEYTAFPDISAAIPELSNDVSNVTRMADYRG